MNRQLIPSKIKHLEIISTLCFIVFLVFSPSWIHYFLQGDQNLNNLSDIYISINHFLPGSIIFVFILFIFLILKFITWISLLIKAMRSNEKYYHKFEIKSILLTIMCFFIATISCELFFIFSNIYIRKILINESFFNIILQNSFIYFFIGFVFIYLIDSTLFLINRNFIQNIKLKKTQRFHITYCLIMEAFSFCVILFLTNKQLALIYKIWNDSFSKKGILPWYKSFLSIELPYIGVVEIIIMLATFLIIVITVTPLLYIRQPLNNRFFILKKIQSIYLYKSLFIILVLLIATFISTLIFFQLIYSPDIIALENVQIIFPILAIPYSVTYLYYGLTLSMIIYIAIQMHKDKKQSKLPTINE